MAAATAPVDGRALPATPVAGRGMTARRIAPNAPRTHLPLGVASTGTPGTTTNVVRTGRPAAMAGKTGRMADAVSSVATADAAVTGAAMTDAARVALRVPRSAGPMIAAPVAISDVTVNDRTIVVVTVVPGVRSSRADATMAHVAEAATVVVTTDRGTAPDLERTAGATGGRDVLLMTADVDA
ncbi:hypothetical protein [Flexivirga alba]|uniref:Flagellar biosynthesis protein FlgA n=1 Tax=Flexivirga alba TaxID=702742 RepID=A0ABW2AKS3_9MICO